MYMYMYIYTHIYKKPYLHPSISTALMRPRRPKQYCLQLVIYIYIYIGSLSFDFSIVQCLRHLEKTKRLYYHPYKPVL